MIQYLYLGRVSYEEGLRLQSELVELRHQQRLHNILLLLEHPAVLTLGRNANRANVLASSALLASRGITVHDIDRGGDVTYHGPGQLVGYPIFDLRSLHKPETGARLGAVDFVRLMEEALIRVCGIYGVPAGRIPGLTGVWCPPAGKAPDEAAPQGKVAAIGIHVSRGITSHGFAFNIATDLRDFSLIIPCGIADHPVTSLENEMRFRADGQPTETPALETVAHQTARQFGQVLNEQVLAVESLAALRAQAQTPNRIGQQQQQQSFPAEDTPLKVPTEVQRLLDPKAPAIRA